MPKHDKTMSRTNNKTYREEWEQHAALHGTNSVSRKQFKNRIAKGWSVKKAIKTPSTKTPKQTTTPTTKQTKKVASKSKKSSMNQNDWLAILVVIDILLHVFW